MLNIPNDIKNTLKIFENNGFEAFIVGGCVRDLLLKKDPDDYDITTNALPSETKSLFEKTLDTGLIHGTVSVFTETGRIVEITTYRSDGDYLDGRRPESVSFVKNIKEDLARRDFTVNALAYNETAGLIDCFGGLKDLKNKVLKAVGNPEKRFGEDALRIMRLFRFESTLLFKGDANTEKSALSLCRNLSLVSGERILTELKKAIMGDDILPLERLIKHGGLSSFGINKRKSIKKISVLKKSEALRLFALFELCDCNFDILKEKLKISNETLKYCTKAESILFLNKRSSMNQVKFALCVCDYNILCDVCDYKTYILNKDLQNIKQKAKQIIDSCEPYKISQLAVNGNDLKALGIKGEDIGNMLEHLCKEVRKNPRLNTKNNLIKLINKSN